MARPLLVLLTALLLAACGGDENAVCTAAEVEEPQAPAVNASTDILAQLRAIPEIEAVEEFTSRYPDMRLFVFEFAQPLNPCNPDGEWFRQTGTLLYRNRDAPVVYSTNGYAVSRNPVRTEPTVLLTANQLSVEHRFFGSSHPETVEAKDWKQLNIFNAAADHHRIRRALRNVLPGEWVSTGASKGGMTAIFYRHYYPDDVRATLAYVAPETFGLADPRYVTFLENVGDPTCRAALETFQRAVVSRLGELLGPLGTHAATHEYTFEIFGPEETLRFAALEASFAFWQYGDATMCAQIPAADAPAADLIAFLEALGMFIFLDDYGLQYYAPYFYQAATELGSTAYPQDHLLEFTGGQEIPDRVENYPPYGVEKPFNPEPMERMHAWVRDSAERILFIYGQNDPWSAGMFDPNEAGDSHLFVVPDGNHSASISDLPEPERSSATAVLTGWMGVTAPVRPPLEKVMRRAEGPR